MKNIERLGITRLCPSSTDASIIAVFTMFLVAAIGIGGCDKISANAKDKVQPATAPAKDAHADHGHAHNGDGKHDEHGHAEEDEGENEHAHDHGGHADEVKLTPEAIRRNNIRVARARAQTLAATITSPARVAYNAEQIAHIGSVVTGRVAELKVRVGDEVKNGDVLIVIDSPELGEAQSDFLQKRTAVEIAEPAVGLAKDSYDRAKQLYDQSKGIALTEVQNRQREYQEAKGALLSAKTATTAAENKLHLLGMDADAVAALVKTGEIDPKYTIRAPLAGRVIEREATLGELVGPDKEKLMVLANLGTVWVLADVPEANLGEFSSGAKAQISVPALAQHTFDGTVAYISPELDQATRTARVRVEVPNGNAKLMPGMFARCEIAVGSADAEPVVAVPEEAVQTVEGEPSVFVPVKGEPNTFTVRQVGVGESIGGLVPILAGLEAGESYVSTGSFILKAELGKAGAAHEH